MQVSNAPMIRTLSILSFIPMVVGCGGVKTANQTPKDGLTITEIVPAQGPLAGGVLVEIHGTHFTEENILVTFAGTPASQPTLQENGTLQVLLPARSQPGLVDVVVACASGQATLPEGFEYKETAPISLTGVNPNCGDLAGGTIVVLSGTGFEDGSSTEPRVTFGGAEAASVTLHSNTSLSAVTPAGSAGAVAVTVENANGSATAPNAYTYSDDCAGSGGGGTGGEMLGAIVDFEYVLPAGDAPYSTGGAYFFPTSSVTRPPTGSCMLNPPANISQFTDVGSQVTLEQTGTSATLNKTIQGSVISYDSGQLATSAYQFTNPVTLDIPGGTGFAPMVAQNVVSAPGGEFGVMAQYGLDDWENGITSLADLDISLAWGDQKNTDGTWAIDPFFGSTLSKPVNHVQIIVALQHILDGSMQFLVCEALDTGSFCIPGTSGSSGCSTAGDGIDSVFLAAGGSLLPLGAGALGIVRSNRDLFNLPDGSKGAMDVGVTAVTPITLVAF